MNLKQVKKILNSNITTVLDKLGINFEDFGDNIYSTCPVHRDSDNPRAFSFSKKRGSWKCWTRDCQNDYKNDVFGLIRAVLENDRGQEVNFSEVLKWINSHFKNIDQATEEESTENNQIEEGSFEEIISIISRKYNKNPKLPSVSLTEQLNIPSKYFIDRGFKAQTLKHFGVGDCFEKNSKLYERAIIPIHDQNGFDSIGFIARSIKDYKIPKFLFYPSGFKKNLVLYNLHRATPHIEETNTVFIVEGQGDVWKLYESGIYNAVGMFGKSLSSEQQLILQRMPITRIIALTDNDQAGKESKIELYRKLNRSYTVLFPKFSHKDIGEMTIKQIQQEIIPQVTKL